LLAMPRKVTGDFGTGGKRSSEGSCERTRFPLWQKAVLFGMAYFACAEGSRLLSARGSPDMSFWPSSGLYVAVLLLNDYKAWPWLVLAAAAANIPFDMLEGTPAYLIFVFILANTAGAVVGAWLVRRFVAGRPTMATLREFVGFLFFAGILSTLLGAAISATGQMLLGMTPSLARSFANWWGSTAMATLLVSPFVLAWFSKLPDWQGWLKQPKRLLEAAVLAAGMIAVSWQILVVGKGINSPDKAPIFMFLVWAGLRFGVRGATATNLVNGLLIGFFPNH